MVAWKVRRDAVGRWVGREINEYLSYEGSFSRPIYIMREMIIKGESPSLISSCITSGVTYAVPFRRYCTLNFPRSHEE